MAWVFYGLTGHKRPATFNQIVQALIFTAIIQAAVYAINWLSHRALGTSFTPEGEFVLAVAIAIPGGLLAVRLANNNTVHEWLRYWPRYERWRKKVPWLPKWNWTKRPSWPSQWFSAFNEHQRYIVIHLKDGRRLYGWPEEWPDHPGEGHLILMQPAWLLDNGDQAPLHMTSRIIIEAENIEIVEFLNEEEEVDVSDEELKKVQDRLVAESHKEKE